MLPRTFLLTVCKKPKHFPCFFNIDYKTMYEGKRGGERRFFCYLSFDQNLLDRDVFIHQKNQIHTQTFTHTFKHTNNLPKKKHRNQPDRLIS